jgi:histidinol-phosphatase
MSGDLDLAFQLADAADQVTMRWWSADGVEARTKIDGTPVTDADLDAEEAVLEALRAARPGDGFLGEEVGEYVGTSDRRWIVDGIDGTRFFAAGARTWGTLVALERDGEIVVALATSPAQGRRWWAERGTGTFTGSSLRARDSTRIRVSPRTDIAADRVVTLPSFSNLTLEQRSVVERIAGGRPLDRPWSHQHRVAEGEVDICVWFAGDVWDHAAPSLLVEEAGGRFSDHNGGRRLDTRTAVYSNGTRHEEVLAALGNE